MSDRNRDWLQQELARQLGPVAAPGSLWGRIEAARRAQRHLRSGWILWPALATLLLCASGDLVWEIGKARASMAPLTERDLEIMADGAACDFKSTDPAAIQRWVKARTNMDVPLSCGRSGNARPLGASLIRKRGAVIAAIAFQVGHEAATLFVSDKHSILRWNRDYAIAAASRDTQTECNQCHIDARSQL